MWEKKKPIVIIDHMDVVEAKAADWTRDPFKPVVENGYIYGRGAVDDKFDVSMVVTVLGKLKREGWKPGRDGWSVLARPTPRHLPARGCEATRDGRSACRPSLTEPRRSCRVGAA